MEIPSGTYRAFSVMFCCTQHFTRPTQFLHQKFGNRECNYLAFQYSFPILKLERKISSESNEVRRPVKEVGVHNQKIPNMHNICWGGGGKARQMQQHDSTDKTFKRILQNTF